jgi:hypothetical protein
MARTATLRSASIQICGDVVSVVDAAPMIHTADW